ncbi:MAG: BamA/TamA family outer membrane protein [Bacteroidetes bacterium]|nr:BamA/TamA family outer membrane protein [Bacteroidota bacterium]
MPESQKEGIILHRDTVRTFPDTIPPLPFELAGEKRLSDEDIANKKEGWYVTGLPEAGVDPIRGFGLGANAFLYNNGSRQDPFFYYTPYRSSFSINISAFQSGQVSGGLAGDFPYIFNSKWRLRFGLIFEQDPNSQYYGIAAGNFNYRDKILGQFVSNARFNDYYRNLAVIRPGRPHTGGQETGFRENPQAQYTDIHYNEYINEEYLGTVAVERAFFEGRLRVMIGYELLYVNIDTYDGKTVTGAIDPVTGAETTAINGRTKLTEDYEAQFAPGMQSEWQRRNINGFGGGRMGLVQTGFMWDTRDLEPDPSSGIFAEYAQEISSPLTGSQFNFSKHLVQFVFYKKVLPNRLSRAIFTGRFAVGGIRGSSIPITELFDQWSSKEEGGIHAIGGPWSLRGYKEARFVGNAIAFGNLELRTRIAQARILKQHLAFSAVPFLDYGNVIDYGRITDRLREMRYSPGLGGRIAWNQATILRFDYAWSREDAQFFFVFGHTF